jgi:hypothetical protein
MKAYMALAPHLDVREAHGHFYHSIHHRPNVIALNLAAEKLLAAPGFSDMAQILEVLGHAVPLYWSWPIIAFADQCVALGDHAAAVAGVMATHEAVAMSFESFRILGGHLMASMNGRHGNADRGHRVVGRPGDYGLSSSHVTTLAESHSAWHLAASDIALALKDASDTGVHTVSIAHMLGILRKHEVRPYTGSTSHYWSQNFLMALKTAVSAYHWADIAEDWDCLISAGKQKKKCGRWAHRVVHFAAVVLSSLASPCSLTSPLIWRRFRRLAAAAPFLAQVGHPRVWRRHQVARRIADQVV